MLLASGDQLNITLLSALLRLAWDLSTGTLQHSSTVLPASWGTEDLLCIWFFPFCICLSPGTFVCFGLSHQKKHKNKRHGANPEPPGGLQERRNWTVKNCYKRLRSDVQFIFITAQSVSYESGTMNKDLRLARKGALTGFGHGRRHSCLGYVPKLCIPHLPSTRVHKRECSDKLLSEIGSKISTCGVTATMINKENRQKIIVFKLKTCVSPRDGGCW